ncbi:MAG: hypothetical protein A2Z18_09630 [Armatimonadetes bacterium RBG_16_58_9]|nr:MAG: hypothetical protein A2Z18_09630 [Armatimonadetes bacterium RBG_16_58_9]
MSNDNDQRGVALHFLTGLGIGALVGAVTALLLAPKSGKETRDDIKQAADEMRAKADKVIHDLTESGDELVKKSKEILETTKAKVQQAVDSGKEAIARRREHTAAEAEES